MFKHILVPIDLSHRNERTLRIAVGLARITQSRVTLLHVIQGIAGVSTRELRTSTRHSSSARCARSHGRPSDSSTPRSPSEPSWSSGIPPARSSRRRGTGRWR